ncbi:MAG: type II toxin-antitoxin system RelE/ParE family toxin [Pseudomonadota bacterium]
MPSLRLSEAAADDLESIANHGIEQFGVHQARHYFETLAKQLEEIASDPLRFPEVRHIRPGYRRCVHGVHSIYFRQLRDGVEILRILGRQGLESLD